MTEDAGKRDREVEHNAARGNLVARAEDWRWSVLWRRLHGGAVATEILSRWPLAIRQHWNRRAMLHCSPLSRLRPRDSFLFPVRLPTRFCSPAGQFACS